jgi:hypothetical protein
MPKVKINWRKVLDVGTSIGQMFLPKAVSDAIDQVEDNVETLIAGGKAGWSGPEKQAAALDTLLQGVVIAEGLKGEDLLHDPTVAAAGQRAIDATHAAKEAVAEFKAAIDTFKAARIPPVAAAEG